MTASNNKTHTYAQLVEFEERAADLYLKLARRFVDNKDVSWFWLEMSMAERQHALLLQFCGCEQMITAGLPDRNAVRKLASIFENLEKRAGRENLSLEDAFLIAAELEASEVNDIYAGVIKPIQGTSYVLKKKVEALIPDHLQMLIRSARKFGISALTIAKLVEIKRREAAKAS